MERSVSDCMVADDTSSPIATASGMAETCRVTARRSFPIGWLFVVAAAIVLGPRIWSRLRSGSPRGSATASSAIELHFTPKAMSFQVALGAESGALDAVLEAWEGQVLV